MAKKPDEDAKYEKGMKPNQKAAFKKQDDKNDKKLAAKVKGEKPKGKK